MHKIYFDRHCVITCGPGEEEPENALAIIDENDAVLTDMAETLEASGKDAASICVRSHDPDSAYLKLCSQFREVNAAGGLVTDADGRCLMIFRNGLWDLPKGHQEAGEGISMTALREVAEETGVVGLREGRLICITDHCYMRDCLWHLKHTWWYEMTPCGKSSTTPQTEEGITEVSWVDGRNLGACLENTYPSIREVFTKHAEKSPAM